MAFAKVVFPVPGKSSRRTCSPATQAETILRMLASCPCSTVARLAATRRGVEVPSTMIRSLYIPSAHAARPISSIGCLCPQKKHYESPRASMDTFRPNGPQSAEFRCTGQRPLLPSDCRAPKRREAVIAHRRVCVRFGSDLTFCQSSTRTPRHRSMCHPVRLMRRSMRRR